MLIRDPIHGDIDLSGAEAAVLDSAEVQRLRTIKQLGTAYLVYPGCMHTRFEHCLGTMAVVKRILAGLEKSGTKISPEDQELVAIGALLHDITHIPFGHTFEDERKIFPRHDKGPRLQYYLRPEGELGRTLARLGIAAEIAALLQAQTNDWRVQIISSALDADLLDYLKRDAYMAGLAQTYDQRIFQHFLIVDNQLLLNMVKHNMDRPDVKSEITHLLRLRYYLTERVYFHHAKIVSGAMISKALEMALKHGVKEQDLLELGDYSLFEYLKQVGRKFDPEITALVEAVERRKLLKRAYVLSPASIPHSVSESLIADYHRPGSVRTRLEETIAAATGLNRSQIIVYCPGNRNFREAGIAVLTKTGVQKLNSPPCPQDITQLERQYEGLWRFYVFAPGSHKTQVNKICHELLGFPSEHF